MQTIVGTTWGPLEVKINDRKESQPPVDRHPPVYRRNTIDRFLKRSPGSTSGRIDPVTRNGCLRFAGGRKGNKNQKNQKKKKAPNAQRMEKERENRTMIGGCRELEQHDHAPLRSCSANHGVRLELSRDIICPTGGLEHLEFSRGEAVDNSLTARSVRSVDGRTENQRIGGRDKLEKNEGSGK